MLNNYSVAFIDFDKTLYDLQIPDYEQHRQALAKQLRGEFGIETNLYPILEETARVSENKPVVRSFIHKYIDDVEHNSGGYFYDYAASLLKRIAETTPVIVVSNNSSEVIKERLAAAELLSCVSYVYGRDTAEFFKPKKEVLQYCCTAMDLDPSQLQNFMFAGDSWRDYACASGFAAHYGLSYSFMHPSTLAGLIM